MGMARDGAALLAGLVVCARCGVRLGVHYDDRRHFTDECVSRANHYGQARCQHLPGGDLDAHVSAQVLTALTPAALDLSLAAAERLQEERDTLTQLWQQRLERARYEADRAARHYHAVEPEHRLVARQLEREWGEAGRRRGGGLPRAPAAAPDLTAAERAAIRRWRPISRRWDGRDDDADRKEVIRPRRRARIRDVQEPASGRVRVDGVGGGSPRRRDALGCLEQLSTYPQPVRVTT
jgi:hypothetical protein